MTRCKVRCISITQKVKSYNGPAQDFIYNAEFYPVGNNSEEDKLFWASTPSGSIKLDLIKPDHFAPGKNYYVDFPEAI